ncbi:uncharacterized protein LOC110675827 [Aedes aegypti]|uniref:DUF4797 domain-containing protein n=1 Tax=Aedes aegypti TaxID=7159 RepID=A0A6I8U7V2_AEDAE|nr:uncharacterized protein LOC110675827 [Aedes aegypti]
MLTCEKMDNNNLSPSTGITTGAGLNNNNSRENIYIDIPTPSTRSVSPLSSASPGKDKSFGFFHNIYRKISLKSNDEISISAHEEDSRSSSVDSCSSLSDRLQEPPKQRRSSPCVKLADQISSLDTSGTSSDSVNNSDKHGRATRRSSVRKLLESLSIGTPPRARSLSCSSTSVNFLSQKSLKQKAESKASLFSSNSASATTTTNTNASSKPPPKKILRRPVSYTYIRGISGLPTQRVPRSSICCSYYSR